MNNQLQGSLRGLQMASHLTASQKEHLKKALEAADGSNEEELMLIMEDLNSSMRSLQAKNRELEVEDALERIRSRAMTMQSSNELAEIVGAVFREMTKLHLLFDRCIIMIYDPQTLGSNWWLANPEPGSVPIGVFIKYHDHKPYLDFLNAWKSRISHWEYLLEGSNKKDWDRYLFSETELSHLPGQVISGMTSFDRIYLNVSFNNFGCLLVSSAEPLQPDNIEILKRFGKVFDSTYTRFNDLKQAEAQARESQIEAALEKVRSRTMAMQRSDELREAAQLLFQLVKDLGVHQWACGYNIWEEDRKFCTAWMSAEGQNQKPFKTRSTEDVFLHFFEAAQRGEIFYTEEISGEACAAHYRYLRSLPVADEVMKEWEDSGMPYPTSQIFHIAYFKQGYLMFITYDPVPGMRDVFERFAAVFEQTYTRFLDLQKAEGQARESSIEAALERVRSRTMAMQRSDELQEAASVLFLQVQGLGIPVWTCGYNILNMDKKESTAWMSVQGAMQPSFKIPLTESPTFIHFYNSWQKGEPFYIEEMGGKELEDHYRYMSKLPIFGELLQQAVKEGPPLPTFQVHHVVNFTYGNLIFISHKALPESEDVFKRFGRVFEQTYTRFFDLQTAEAQALEANKRASVDRVRAEIASMRTTADLEKIIPLIWNELTTLGVLFIRCGVFIMDEKEEEVHTFLSNAEGEAIAAFRLPFAANGNIPKVVENWRRKQIFKDHWDEAEFRERSKELLEQSDFTSNEKYQAEKVPTNLHLHFLPFLQGMLYVGTETPLNEEELQLVQNLADAFASAYARYEDFNKLEAAKQQIENTLIDLRQAQTQLIQAEKMASLGQLTAGIAHEIQNPLNFVNNFSDLNTELIQELKIQNSKFKNQNGEGLDLGLLNDIEQNLEKISHHGKRADEIVKGMLQHSRISTGQKEPTDINALCDEYLRLAFHGMRAKDKEFNTSIKTDFDQSIGKINVVPQDIGRVLLNLLNNAFYAVNERNKKNESCYEPRVEMVTRKEKDDIIIEVKDNGMGIPEKIKDKIFQPFFTTKPTGQGTGLGLSLSYDIVKSHGGEIRVSSTEKGGTAFRIEIPTY